MSVSKSVPCSDKKLESDIFGHLLTSSMNREYHQNTKNYIFIENGKFAKKI